MYHEGSLPPRVAGKGGSTIRGASGPYTLHSTPYTLFPAPHALHPTPYTLYPAPYTLHLGLVVKSVDETNEEGEPPLVALHPKGIGCRV